VQLLGLSLVAQTLYRKPFELSDGLLLISVVQLSGLSDCFFKIFSNLMRASSFCVFSRPKRLRAQPGGPLCMLCFFTFKATCVSIGGSTNYGRSIWPRRPRWPLCRHLWSRWTSGPGSGTKSRAFSRATGASASIGPSASVGTTGSGTTGGAGWATSPKGLYVNHRCFSDHWPTLDSRPVVDSSSQGLGRRPRRRRNRDPPDTRRPEASSCKRSGLADCGCNIWWSILA